MNTKDWNQKLWLMNRDSFKWFPIIVLLKWYFLDLLSIQTSHLFLWQQWIHILCAPLTTIPVFQVRQKLVNKKNRFGLKQQQKIDTLHSIEKFLNRVIYWDLLSVNLFLHDNLDISHELEKNIAVLDMWSQYF